MLNQRAEHAHERAGGGRPVNTPILVISAALFIAAITDVWKGIIHDLTTITVAVVGLVLLTGHGPVMAVYTLGVTVLVLYAGSHLVHRQVFRQGDAFLIAATTLAAGPFAPLYLFLQSLTGAGWVWLADTAFQEHLPFAPSTLLAWIPVAALLA